MDSEWISIHVCVETLSNLGIEMSMEDAYDKFLGKSMLSFCQLVQSEYNVVLEDDHLAKMRERLYQRFSEDLQKTSNIDSAISQLQSPYCVASSSQLDRIKFSLKTTALDHLFSDNVFSTSMVSRGKPYPDIFIHVAKQFGVAIKDCLVIEDSPAGITAAKDAQMDVFAYCGARHSNNTRYKEKIATLKPTLIFDDMAQLNMLIDSINP